MNASAAPPPPPGWKSEWSAQYNCPFYVNMYTNESVWTMPTMAAQPPQPSQNGAPLSQGSAPGNTSYNPPFGQDSAATPGPPASQAVNQGQPMPYNSQCTAQAAQQTWPQAGSSGQAVSNPQAYPTTAEPNRGQPYPNPPTGYNQPVNAYGTQQSPAPASAQTGYPPQSGSNPIPQTATSGPLQNPYPPTQYPPYQASPQAPQATSNHGPQNGYFEPAAGQAPSPHNGVSSPGYSTGYPPHQPAQQQQRDTQLPGQPTPATTPGASYLNSNPPPSSQTGYPTPAPSPNTSGPAYNASAPLSGQGNPPHAGAPYAAARPPQTKGAQGPPQGGAASSYYSGPPTAASGPALANGPAPATGPGGDAASATGDRGIGTFLMGKMVGGHGKQNQPAKKPVGAAGLVGAGVLGVGAGALIGGILEHNKHNKQNHHNGGGHSNGHGGGYGYAQGYSQGGNNSSGRDAGGGSYYYSDNTTYVQEDTYVDNTYVTDNTTYVDNTYVTDNTTYVDNTYVADSTTYSDNTYVADSTSYTETDTYAETDTYVDSAGDVEEDEYVEQDTYEVDYDDGGYDW